jgi:hypothetical protein
MPAEQEASKARAYKDSTRTSGACNNSASIHNNGYGNCQYIWLVSKLERMYPGRHLIPSLLLYHPTCVPKAPRSMAKLCTGTGPTCLRLLGC